MTYFFRLSVLASLCALSTVPASAQQDLILPVEEGLSVSGTQEAALASLRASKAVREIRSVRVRPEALRSGEAVRVGEHVLAPGRTEARRDGSFSWFSDPGAVWGHFTVREGRVAGEIYASGERYALRPLSGGLHAFVRVDARELPPEHSADASPEPLANPGLGPDAGGAATGTAARGEPIGVIVAYTAESVAEAGDVALLAQLSVDQTNESYRATNLDVRLELVHTYQTATPSSGNMGLDLRRLRSPNDGYFDEVEALRYTHGGDLVVLIGPGSNTYGLCGLAGDVGATEETAFAMVAHDCSTVSYTFAHEIGHLQGARHNPENDVNPRPFPHGHGTTNIEAGFRTVMGYNRASCPGGWCEKLLSWSSPEVLHQGVPTGDTEIRDNARVLRETTAEIAAFRTAGPRPALSPGLPRLTVDVPHGQDALVSLGVTNTGGNRLRWSASLDQSPIFPNADGTFSPSEGRYGHAWRDSNDPSGGVSFNWVAPRDSVSTGSVRGYRTPFPITALGASYHYLNVGRGTVHLHNAPDGIPRDNDNYGVYLSAFGGHLTGAETWESPPRGRIHIEEVAPGLLTVHWLDFYAYVPPYITPLRGVGRYSFQALLYADGAIEYQYLTHDGPPDVEMTVGIEEAGYGVRGLIIAEDAGYAEEGLAIRIEPSASWLGLPDAPRDLFEGESQELNLAIRSRDLREGTYTATLTLTSPEDYISTVRVPIEIRVVAPTSAEPASGETLSALGRPSPNPARGAVRVPLTLAAPEAVTVTVLDMTGREIARLTDGPLAAGTHALVWDSSRAAPGAYAIRLITPEAMEVRRVVVMR